jgi:hypothetical protein
LRPTLHLLQDPSDVFNGRGRTGRQITIARENATGAHANVDDVDDPQHSCTASHSPSRQPEGNKEQKGGNGIDIGGDRPHHPLPANGANLDSLAALHIILQVTFGVVSVVAVKRAGGKVFQGTSPRRSGPSRKKTVVEYANPCSGPGCIVRIERHGPPPKFKRHAHGTTGRTAKRGARWSINDDGTAHDGNYTRLPRKDADELRERFGFDVPDDRTPR